MSPLVRISSLLLVTGLAAQSPADLEKLRSDARAAYKTWRESDSNLEADARTADKNAWHARIARAGEQADRVAHARIAVANAALASAKATLEIVDRDWGRPDAAAWIAAGKAQDAQLMRQSNILNRNVEVFAADKDAGIQQVKSAMEEERAALEAVRVALSAEQRALTALSQLVGQGESARALAAARSAELFAGAKQEEDILEKEAALWQAYYAALPQAADARPASSPATSLPTGDTGRASQLSPVDTKPAEGAPAAMPSSERSPDASRWTGGWVYPMMNGMFYGDEPEFVDLAVDEQNGRLMGSLTARFKIPSGAARDPMLRFDFNGPLSTARTQKLEAIGPDGEKGVLELLPGPAANLLEVNWLFPTPQQPRPLQKVRQGNVILIRK